MIDQKDMLIELQYKEIERLVHEAEDIREVTNAILTQLGFNEWLYGLDKLEEFLHKRLADNYGTSATKILPNNFTTSYRFRTRDVEVKYLKDRWNNEPETR